MEFYILKRSLSLGMNFCRFSSSGPWPWPWPWPDDQGAKWPGDEMTGDEMTGDKMYEGTKWPGRNDWVQNEKGRSVIPPFDMHPLCKAGTHYTVFYADHFMHSLQKCSDWFGLCAQRDDLHTFSIYRTACFYACFNNAPIPTRGNLFLQVRLRVAWFAQNGFSQNRYFVATGLAQNGFAQNGFNQNRFCSKLDLLRMDLLRMDLVRITLVSNWTCSEWICSEWIYSESFFCPKSDLLRKDLLRMDLLRKDLLRKDLFGIFSRGLLHLVHAFVAVTKILYKGYLYFIFIL
jgi:hypothetical protein